MIDPASVAFDIDGVVADTMTLFIDIAREEYDIDWIRYEDITSYYLEECITIDSEITSEIINCMLDGDYTIPLQPVTGAAEVLTCLGKSYSPILFVTARPYLGPIHDWMSNILQLDEKDLEIITTGSFEGKKDVLLSKNISYFVEDRLETCVLLKEAGIIPILFKQPWNREKHPFKEVCSWSELGSLII